VGGGELPPPFYFKEVTLATQLEICNLAMTVLGADTIVALSDSSANARRITAVYTPCLEDVLRSHPWNFAIMRTQLAVAVTTPTYGYDYEFALPADCLRVIEVSDSSAPIDEFKIEGVKLLINYNSSVYIKYIKNETDTTKYTSQFSFVLASRLASELAYAITNNKETADLAMKIYQARLQQTKETDSQESDSVNVVDQDSWAIEHRI
jgi:hypothetical protein